MSVVDASLRSTLDAMTMDQLLEWAPDVRGHVQPLHLCRVGDVRRMFGGIPPAFVSMWCCMAGVMSEDRIHAALRAPMRDVWRVYFDWRVQQVGPHAHDPPYPPGPRIIAMLLPDKT